MLLASYLTLFSDPAGVMEFVTMLFTIFCLARLTLAAPEDSGAGPRHGTQRICLALSGSLPSANAKTEHKQFAAVGVLLSLPKRCLRQQKRIRLSGVKST